MVQTRRAYNRWVATRGDDYQTSQEDQCDSCSQRSEASSQGTVQSFDYHGGSQASSTMSQTSSVPNYSANDRCKRHRRADGYPYVTRVVSYSRRKPRT